MKAKIVLDRQFYDDNLTIVAWCYNDSKEVIMRRMFERKRPADMTQFRRDVMKQIKNELRTLGYEVND